jgi:hypothetical protein
MRGLAIAGPRFDRAILPDPNKGCNPRRFHRLQEGSVFMAASASARVL